MKTIQILVLILGFVIIANAQVDCVVENKVFVRDYDGNNVKNAKLEIYKVEKGFNKTFAFSPQRFENDTYFFISVLGDFRASSGKFFSVSNNYWLKVTAENFKVHERLVRFERCKSQEFNVILEQINQKIKLTGVIYDTNGAVIVGVNVKATNKNGESYSVKTDDNGIYTLNLLPDFYRIEFEEVGFKKHIIEKFQLVNSTYGRINQDIVLIVNNPEPCGYTGIDCLYIEQLNNEQTKVSNKISLKPLEKLPKGKIKTNEIAEAIRLTRFYGKAYDENNALIPSANIEITDEKGRTYSSKTDDDGRFEIDLPIGNYTVQISKTGFRVLKVINFQIEDTKDIYLDLTLKIRGCDDCDGDILGENNGEKRKEVVLDYQLIKRKNNKE